MGLIIDTEFHSLIPPLSSEECAGLEASILAEGCRDAVLVWLYDSQLLIVDGHNRYEICTKHNLPYETRTMFFDSRELAKEWIIRNQFSRRNLSLFQRSELALQLKPLIEVRAKENQGTRTDISQNSAESLIPVDTREELAKVAGVSHDTISRVEKITSEATIDQINRLKSMESSINEVYNEIKNRPHVSNNSGNNEWYTPSEYIESARLVMGEITLDPASSELANTVVKAEDYFTVEMNGIESIWYGKIWLNPPYSSDLVSQFINILVESYTNKDVDEAIVLVNNATETKWFQSLIEIATAVCFTFGRVKFWCPEGIQGAPLQGQAIVYVGDNPIAFRDEFKKHGWVAFPDLDKLFPVVTFENFS